LLKDQQKESFEERNSTPRDAIPISSFLNIRKKYMKKLSQIAIRSVEELRSVMSFVKNSYEHANNEGLHEKGEFGRQLTSDRVQVPSSIFGITFDNSRK
jgi:hypothetical protein